MSQGSLMYEALFRRVETVESITTLWLQVYSMIWISIIMKIDRFLTGVIW